MPTVAQRLIGHYSDKQICTLNKPFTTNYCHIGAKLSIQY